jgi:epoxyqueuosine reductase
MRARREGLLRNACIALGNIGDPATVPVLRTVLSQEASALIREHACWALGRMRYEPLAERALRHAAYRDPDLCVRQEAELALAEAHP